VLPASVVVVCTLAGQAGGPVLGGAVFAGVATRDPGQDAAAERAAVAVAQALQKHGVADVGTPPLPAVAEGTTDPHLDNAVAAALARYQEGDFARAIEKADDAIGRFESKLAFAAGGPWPSYAQALVVKALALKKLGKEADVDAPFLKMASTMPAAVPDAAIAPAKLVERHAQLLAGLKAKARVQLDVSSTPPGATVIVDGTARGQTPVVVRDLLPGTHFVRLEADGDHIDKKVDVSDGTVKVEEQVGDPRVGAAKALREALARAADAATLAERAKDVGADVIAGVIVPDGTRGTALVLVRVQAGADPLIAGTHLEDEGPLKGRVGPIAEALMDAVVAPEGTWLPAAEGSPRDLLFGTATVVSTGPKIDDPPPEDDEGGNAALFVVLGVGAGALVLAGAGVVTALLLAQSANTVEVRVDASSL
jgi:hypothetical protein